jgi:hypothetical protein
MLTLSGEIAAFCYPAETREPREDSKMDARRFDYTLIDEIGRVLITEFVFELLKGL